MLPGIQGGMGRRLLLLLFALVLGTVAWFAARGDAPAEEGLVAIVQVLDENGAPIYPAQVERVYDEARVTLDKRGRARLSHVTLRANDVPSPDAFAAALKPIARYYALPPRSTPGVQAHADGTYEVRFHLKPCGLLRVRVAPTHLGRCKAFLAEESRDDRWMRVGAHEVVRPGSVVDFRIFQGAQQLTLRVEGEPDARGLVGVATHHQLVEAPSPGHVRQVTIEPEPARPILGHVLAGDGPPPPTLEGTVTLDEVVDGREVAWGQVPIAEDGSFRVFTSSEAEYHVSAKPLCYGAPSRASCHGGELVELRASGPPQWLVLSHPGLDTHVRPVAFRARDPATGEMASLLRPFRWEGERTWLVAGRRRRWRIVADVAGTPAAPPLRAGPVDVDGTVSGEIRVELPVAEVPSGTLVVKTTPGSWTNVRSASVHVDQRGATLVRKTAEQAELLHVRAGTQLLTAEWDDDVDTTQQVEVVVKAGGRTEVTLDRQEGTPTKRE